MSPTGNRNRIIAQFYRNAVLIFHYNSLQYSMNSCTFPGLVQILIKKQTFECIMPSLVITYMYPSGWIIQPDGYKLWLFNLNILHRNFDCFRSGHIWSISIERIYYQIYFFASFLEWKFFTPKKKRKRNRGYPVENDVNIVIWSENVASVLWWWEQIVSARYLNIGLL